MTRPGTDRQQIEWTSDLIRLEIMLWDRVDARLRHQHDLPLSFFESLHFVGATRGGLRVGDLARRLGVTVGGTSKLVDRIEQTGLIARELDPGDRRASRVVLTQRGRRTLRAARTTYQDEVARFLDPVLTTTEQQQFHGFVTRLLAAAEQGESA